MCFYLQLRQNKCFVLMTALILIAEGNVKPLAFASSLSKHYSFIQYVSQSIVLSNKYMTVGWNFVYVSFIEKKKKKNPQFFSFKVYGIEGKGNC